MMKLKDHMQNKQLALWQFQRLELEEDPEWGKLSRSNRCGSEFRQQLIQKEVDLKHEEIRKQNVQLEREEKRKSIALQKEQNKAISETKKRERDEKKRITNIAIQQRKEERNRKLE